MQLHNALDAIVTKAEALHEILRHACNFAEFLQDVGDKDEYTGKEVLGWLGY